MNPKNVGHALDLIRRVCGFRHFRQGNPIEFTVGDVGANSLWDKGAGTKQGVLGTLVVLGYIQAEQTSHQTTYGITRESVERLQGELTKWEQKLLQNSQTNNSELRPSQ